MPSIYVLKTCFCSFNYTITQQLGLWDARMCYKSGLGKWDWQQLHNVAVNHWPLTGIFVNVFSLTSLVSSICAIWFFHANCYLYISWNVIFLVFFNSYKLYFSSNKITERREAKRIERVLASQRNLELELL